MNPNLIEERNAKLLELLQKIGVQSLSELAHARLLLQFICVMKDCTFDVLTVIVSCGRIELGESNIVIDIPKEQQDLEGYDGYPYEGTVPTAEEWAAFESDRRRISFLNVDFSRDGDWSCFVDFVDGGGDFRAPYFNLRILT